MFFPRLSYAAGSPKFGFHCKRILICHKVWKENQTQLFGQDPHDCDEDPSLYIAKYREFLLSDEAKTLPFFEKEKALLAHHDTLIVQQATDDDSSDDDYRLQKGSISTSIYK